MKFAFLFRFVIGKRGCVIKDIESRCGVKISFPEDSEDPSQTVVLRGDCNDDITEAIVSYHVQRIVVFI